jgi:hypothetical protein
MRKIAVIFLSIILFAFTYAVETDSYTGYAYKEGVNKPVYTERFTDKTTDGKPTETITKYYDADNKLIAQRTLNFSKSKFAPDFKTEDFRTGYQEGAEIKGKKVRLFVKESKDEKLREKTISIPSPAVIDGGFNQYIKANWSELEKGKALVFNFAVASRLDYYKMRAVKISSTDKTMKVKIEPERKILRMLASPIVVNYDKSTKRILSYEGISNISDEHGDNFTIRLVYPEKGP